MLEAPAIASGLLVGLTLGLLGSGGSILALPLLVGFVGLDVHAAVPNSLAAVGAIAGNFQHHVPVPALVVLICVELAHAPALLRRVPLIHPPEHACEVLGIVPARAREYR